LSYCPSSNFPTLSSPSEFFAPTSGMQKHDLSASPRISKDSVEVPDREV